MSSTAFGRYIRMERVKADISLRTVADHLGVTHVYLGEVERGVRGPLKRDRWPALMEVVRSITQSRLEEHEARSRPLQLNLPEAPPRYQDLALALARRMETQDLSDREIKRCLDILRNDNDGE